MGATFTNRVVDIPLLTAGSIPFVVGGNLAEDNARLFWDALNARMGIGNNAPNRTLDITGELGVSDRIYLTGAAPTIYFTNNAPGPGSAGGGPPASFIGVANTVYLADPADWLPVNVAGTDRVIPLY